MDGIHDMGGMDGFGGVEPERDEPVFHHRWEGRVVALTRAMSALGYWNIDVGRWGIEMLPPEVYLTSSYYQRWLLRTTNLLLERGVLTQDELTAGRPQAPHAASGRTYTRADAERFSRDRSYERPARAPARFRVGDRVRARNMHPRLHTRLPRYARGRVGVVERVQGCHVFPDAVVAGRGEDPQWLYTVRFEATELWGADADPKVKVSIEAFEPYLEHG